MDSTEGSEHQDGKASDSSESKLNDAGRRYITKRRVTPDNQNADLEVDVVEEVKQNAPKRPSGNNSRIRISGNNDQNKTQGQKRPSGDPPKRPSNQGDSKRPSGGTQEPKRPSNQGDAKRPSGEPKRTSNPSDAKRPSGEPNRPSGQRQTRGSSGAPVNKPQRGNHKNKKPVASEQTLEEQQRQSTAKLLVPQPPRQRWSSTAQLGTFAPQVGERLTPVDSDGDADEDQTAEPAPASTTANVVPRRKFSAPSAPSRSLVNPIYSPERVGTQPPYKGVPVVYVPVPLPMRPNSEKSSDETLLSAVNSSLRLQCKFWKQGNCKFGESCAFSHSDDSLVLLPPMPQVIPPPAPTSPPQKSTGKPADQKWHGVGSLPKEQTLAALRFLAHIEEVQANHMDVVIQTEGGIPTSITELYYRLETREVPLIISLNDLLNTEEIISITDCASRIVPLLPEATLDLGAILNTSRLVDNDALLFFCYLLKDVQEHFYHEFKAKYLVTTPDGAYNTDAIGKILEQIGVTESQVMSKFNFSEAKTAIQGIKRWKSLYILNDPTLITLVNKQTEVSVAEDLKWQILRRLDEHVRAVVRAREASTGVHTETSPSSSHVITQNSSAKLPAFEVRTYDEPRGQSSRKKNWLEFSSTLSPIELYSDLCTNVAELVVPGLTNFAAIFSVLSEKLKMRRFSDNERNLDAKLAAIAKMLTTWPEVLLLPEVLQRSDGKLHTFRSVTAQHQFGSVYVEMMTRLKKKYLYKSSLEKLN